MLVTFVKTIHFLRASMEYQAIFQYKSKSKAPKAILLLNRAPAHRPPILLTLRDEAEALPLLAEVGKVVGVQLVAGHVLWFDIQAV